MKNDYRIDWLMTTNLTKWLQIDQKIWLMTTNWLFDQKKWLMTTDWQMTNELQIDWVATNWLQIDQKND